MNSVLLFLQENSFLMSVIIAGVGGGGATLLKFRDMGTRIHSLHKRLTLIEDVRIAHIEATMQAQATTLTTIDERTKNMQHALSRIEDHLLSQTR